MRANSGLILSRARLAQRHGPLVHVAVAIAVEGMPKHALVLPYGKREQGHGRAELQVIRRAEDRVERLPLESQHRFGAQDQSWPEQRVSQIGACFIKRAHPVELSHRRVSEAAQLRKDEPHPVALLPASLQFIQGSSEDGRLRGHEAVQVEGISVRHLRPPPGDLRWRLRPTRLSIGIGSSCGRSLNAPIRSLVGPTWAMAVWRLSGRAKKPIWPPANVWHWSRLPSRRSSPRRSARNPRAHTP